MEVFFYGLFMDVDLLEKKGLKPADPRKAQLMDYSLKIGKRASLVPCQGKTAYGLLVTVDEKAIHELYSHASVADYIPEEVKVFTDSKTVIKATCYNLPLEMLSGTNAKYAQSLYELAMKLDFPDDYLEHIRGMAD